MAIPIKTGVLKVYRNRSGIWTQIYPESENTTKTVRADCQGMKATETVQVMASSATVMPDVAGTDEPNSLELFKIFADWLKPATFYPEVKDLIVFQDTTGEAAFKTAVFQQVSVEPPHTGTRLRHVKFICIRTKTPFPTDDFITSLTLPNQP